MNKFNFQKDAAKALDWIDHYLQDIEKYPVLAEVSPGDIRKQLPQKPPVAPESFDQILTDFKKIIVPGITHWTHPAFFAYFAITSSTPGILAEALTAALNVNGMLWRTSPSATELEETVTDWLRQLVDLPDDYFGVLNDTASVSTLCALATARESLNLGIREHGMAGRNLPRLRIYASEQSHSSVEKAAIILGFGQEGLRKIPVDHEFQMKPELLNQAIEEDIAQGWKPVAVVATVGTTSTTSIDPIPQIAEICSSRKIWLHVDGAHAGAAAILPEMRFILNGVERADSFVFNPHKWLATPVDCSALFTRHPEMLKQAFSLVPEYLKTDLDRKVHNFMDYGIQLGRRFRALKVWIILRMYGKEGIQNAIRSNIALGQELAKWIDDDPSFERMAPTPLSTLCFRAVPKEIAAKDLDRFNEELLNAINHTGKVFLSHTKLNNQFVIRLSIGNYNTQKRHIEMVWNLLHLSLKDLLDRAARD